MVQSLTQESHLKVLRLLEVNPSLTQREIALALGVSLGKANYCIRALMSKGLLKMQNFRSSEHRLAYAYLLTPAGITAKVELATRFLQIKINEYEVLKREIEQLQQEVEHLTF